jgi:O-antigen ligase
MTRGSRTIDALLFATAFVVTWTKVRFSTPLGDVFVSDLAASLFVVAVLASRLYARDWSLPRTAALAAGFFGIFMAVFLVGFYNLETAADRDLFVRGLVKFAVHFAFVVVAVAYLTRRSARLYWQTLAWFLAGFVANAVYGILQLGFAEVAGRNLDELVLGTFGLYERGGIGVFGVAASGANVYRTNALTLDSNNLSVMLCVPVVMGLAFYLRLPRGHRLRTPAALVLAFLVLVMLTTLSRSGLLGLAAGLLVLAIPYHHLFLRPRFLVPVGALGLVLLGVVAARAEFFREVFEARTQTSGSSTQLHFEFYALIKPVFEDHPLFGMGLNTFATYYEFLTGREDYGPHSYYVALLTETGVVGALVFAAWLVLLFRRLADLRRLGRRLAEAGDRLADRVRPLAWGLAAALVATLAANVFYLTMQMYYFFFLAVLILAAPAVFSRREPV